MEQVGRYLMDRPSSEIEEAVKSAYDAFNRRDLDAALAAMTEDVTWANGFEGGFVHGRAGVAEYWRRQWTELDPYVIPRSMTLDDRGRVIVEVYQEVRDLSGETLAAEAVRHAHTLEQNLIARFDILAAENPPST